MFGFSRICIVIKLILFIEKDVKENAAMSWPKKAKRQKNKLWVHDYGKLIGRNAAFCGKHEKFQVSLFDASVNLHYLNNRYLMLHLCYQTA